MDSFISAFILKLDINRLCMNSDPGPLELHIPGLLIIANYSTWTMQAESNRLHIR